MPPLQDTTIPVQAAIASYVFTETLIALEEMVIPKNRDFGPYKSDLDALLEFAPNCNVTWTAPKWMQPGDVLFFYYTKSSKQRISSLLKETIDLYGTDHPQT